MIVTIVIAAVATACVLATGGALTEIGPWYYSLRNPAVAAAELGLRADLGRCRRLHMHRRRDHLAGFAD